MPPVLQGHVQQQQQHDQPCRRQPPLQAKGGDQHNHDPQFKRVVVLKIGAAPFDQRRQGEAHPEQPKWLEQPFDAERGDECRQQRQRAEQQPTAGRPPPRPPIRRGDQRLDCEQRRQCQTENEAAVQIGPQDHQRYEPQGRRAILVARLHQRGGPQHKNRQRENMRPRQDVARDQVPGERGRQQRMDRRQTAQQQAE